MVEENSMAVRHQPYITKCLGSLEPRYFYLERTKLMSVIEQKYVPIKDDRHEEYRKKLASYLHLQVALQDAESVFELSYDGYGDSGTEYISDEYPEPVRELLQDYFNTYVNFDWYNNDGGGGHVHWDVSTNKVEIYGYYNVTESVTEIEEEY